MLFRAGILLATLAVGFLTSARPPEGGRHIETALSPAVAQASSPAAAQPTFEARLERLAEEIERRRVETHVPGAALVVVRGGEVVFARGFGLADRENGTPVTPDTRFYIGSATKAFTATLIGMLVDDGAMAWDDPVERHLPFFTLDVDSPIDESRATIRDILSHRTGFPRMPMLWANGALSSDQILRQAAGAEPFAPFRQRFYYNNVMYLAAGSAAAAAGGTDWGTLVTRRILTPLGMTDTDPVLRDPARVARGYAWNEDLAAFQLQSAAGSGGVTPVAPAGAIVSSVMDMAKWVSFLLADGVADGRRLIAHETLAETWTRQIAMGGGVNYGLGWMLRTFQGQRLIEHGGNVPGFSAEVGLLPDADLGFVLLTNASTTSLQGISISLVPEILLGAVAEAGPDAGPDAAPAEDFGPYLGQYIANFATFSNETFTILERNGRLALDIPSQQVYDLNPPAANGRRPFTLTNQIAVSFQRNDRSEVVSLTMHQAGASFEVPREGVEVEPEIPLAELRKYLGVYRNENIGTELTILIQNQRLALQNAGTVLDLHPPDDNGRRVTRARPDVSIAFTEENGRVTGLEFYRPNKLPVLRLARSSAAEAPLPTVEDLLALRRAAAGAGPGAVTNYRITGGVRFPQSAVSGRFEILVKGDDRYRLAIDLGVLGSMQNVVGPDGAWSVTSFEIAPFQELRGDALAQARQSHPSAVDGNWPDHFDTVDVLNAGEFAGRPVLIVRLQDAGLPAIRLSVDAETGDVLRIERRMILPGDLGALPVTDINEAYRTVGGMRVPFRFIESNELSGRTVFDVESIDVDVAIDDAVFLERPAGRR